MGVKLYIEEKFLLGEENEKSNFNYNFVADLRLLVQQ